MAFGLLRPLTSNELCKLSKQPVIFGHEEFCPGEPCLFCRDPAGYEVEIWYELPDAG